MTGLVVAAAVASGSGVGAAVPGLGGFAVSFVGLAGALVVLAVARGRRVRFPVPAATVLVAGGVAAAIVMTVVFLLREPAAAAYLPPARAVLLAAVLAGCLWVAVASPRSLGTSRLAPRIGVNLADAVFWCLMFAPVVGVPCAVFGAALAACIAPRATQAQPDGAAVNL